MTEPAAESRLAASADSESGMAIAANCRASAASTLTAVRCASPRSPTEQKAEQQHAEHLADCHSGEDQLRHCPAVAADCVQQHADGGNAHQLLSCFTDHGVLHAFQSDEQRLEDIFNPGQHKAEQHERKRLCRMRIAENAC